MPEIYRNIIEGCRNNANSALSLDSHMNGFDFIELVCGEAEIIDEILDILSKPSSTNPEIMEVQNNLSKLTMILKFFRHIEQQESNSCIDSFKNTLYGKSCNGQKVSESGAKKVDVGDEEIRNIDRMFRLSPVNAVRYFFDEYENWIKCYLGVTRNEKLNIIKKRIVDNLWNHRKVNDGRAVGITRALFTNRQNTFGCSLKVHVILDSKGSEDIINTINQDQVEDGDSDERKEEKELLRKSAKAASEAAYEYIRTKVENCKRQTVKWQIEVYENQYCGSSIGLALTVAIISAYLNSPVPDNIAFTGEIVNTGRICRVEGVKTKVYAAYYEKLDRVYLPYANNNDAIKDIDVTKTKFVANIQSVGQDIFKPEVFEKLNSEYRNITQHKLGNLKLNVYRNSDAPIVVNYETDFIVELSGEVVSKGVIQLTWKVLNKEWFCPKLDELPKSINCAELPFRKKIEFVLKTLKTGKMAAPSIELEITTGRYITKLTSQLYDVIVEEAEYKKIDIKWSERLRRIFRIPVEQQRKISFKIYNPSNVSQVIKVVWIKSTLLGNGIEEQCHKIYASEVKKVSFVFKVSKKYKNQIDMGKIKIGYSKDSKLKDDLFTIPYRLTVEYNYNPKIINRTRELNFIEELFQSIDKSCIVYIKGDRGVGKSQLVRSSIESLKEKYNALVLNTSLNKQLQKKFGIKGLFRSLLAIESDIDLETNIENFIRKYKLEADYVQVRNWSKWLSEFSRSDNVDEDLLKSNLGCELTFILQRILNIEENPIIMYIEDLHENQAATEIQAITKLLYSFINNHSNNLEHKILVIMEWREPEGQNNLISSIQATLDILENNGLITIEPMEIIHLSDEHAKNMILKIRPNTPQNIVDSIVELSNCYPLWIRECIGLYNTSPTLYNNDLGLFIDDCLKEDNQQRRLIFEKRIEACLRNENQTGLKNLVEMILTITALFPEPIPIDILIEILDKKVTNLDQIDFGIALDVLERTDFVREDEDTIFFTHQIRRSFYKTKYRNYFKKTLWNEMAEILKTKIVRENRKELLTAIAAITLNSGKLRESFDWNKKAAEYLSSFSDNTKAIKYYDNAIGIIDSMDEEELIRQKSELIFKTATIEKKCGNYNNAVKRLLECIVQNKQQDISQNTKYWFVITNIQYHSFDLASGFNSFVNFLNDWKMNPELFAFNIFHLDFETLMRLSGAEELFLKTLNDLKKWAKEHKNKQVLISAIYAQLINEGYTLEPNKLLVKYKYLFHLIKNASIKDKHRNSLILSHCYYRLANVYQDWGLYEDSISYLDKSIEIAEQNNLKNRWHIAMYYKMYMFWQTGDFKRALKIYNQLIRIINEFAFARRRIFFYFSGLLFKSLKNPEKSLELLNKSLDIAIYLDSFQGMINVTPLIAEIYIDKGDIEEAEKRIDTFYSQLNEIFHATKPVEYYNWNLIRIEAKLMSRKKEAERMVDKLNNWESRLKECCENMRRGPFYYIKTMGKIYGEVAKCYARISNFKKSNEFKNQADEMFRQMNLNHLIVELEEELNTL